MAQKKRLHSVITAILIGSSVLFLGLLAGFGSGFLTEDPPAVSPYATSGTQPPADATTPSAGESLFAARCKSCHGADLAGGVGPALGAGSRIAGVTDDEVRGIITNGRRGMPSFGDRLESSEIDAIVEYLREAQSG